LLFHSFAYLLLFTVTAVVYWRLPGARSRAAWLLLAGIVFYGSWSLPLVGVVLLSASIDWGAALLMDRVGSEAARRRLLVASLAVSLGLLAYFKYANLLLETAWTLGRPLGLAPGAAPHLEILLPLGISFYTFETISYVVDVYRRRLPAERSLLRYGVFLLFFPHLIAGPIVRPESFLPQVDRRPPWRWRRVYFAAWIFTSGLFKKAVLADQLGRIVDPVFAAADGHGVLALWTASLAYAAQIYCDFSGYSDMAVGSALALGFRLPRNFRRPFLAETPSDLWRRWHVTLMRWLRDYVFLPLGGASGGAARTARNIMLTFLVSGLWHGASWKFVIWGAYNGALLLLQRFVPWPSWTSAPALRPLRVLLTQATFVLGLVLFRAPSIPDAVLMLRRMLGVEAGPSASLPATVVAVVLGTVAMGWMVQAVASRVSGPRLDARLSAALAGLALGLWFLLVQLGIPAAAPAFIYFQF
jgi:alginate O-acetyltransferase complex protein AlgI